MSWESALPGTGRQRNKWTAPHVYRLSEVTSCFAKGPNGTVGPQIDCPSHVMGGRDSGHCSRFVINELGKCLARDMQTKK
mmetsp:Transcript_1287/g.3968  ORF Transcript_1287/g.3968 Transcript_1287/m.3968 type:complete len:80 (+) Transcript_1287:1-240(+)